MRKLLVLSGFLLLTAPVLAAPTPLAANDSAVRVIRVSNGGSSQSITMGLNKAVEVVLDNDVKEADVAGPDIVDAVVKSPRRVLLIAEKLGQTNALFTDANGRRVLSLDIRVERDVADLNALMQAALPKSAIKVTAINDNVVLAGNVSNAMEASRAVNLAAGFTGDPKKVVDMLSVTGGEQVMLKVRVAEMSRSIAKQFGVNASGAVNVGGVPIISNTNNPYGLLGHALSDASGAQIGSVCPQAFIPNRTATTTSAMTTGNSTVNTLTNGVNNSATTYNTAINSSNPNLQQPGVVTGNAVTDVVTGVASAVQTISSALAPTVTQTITSTSPCASANNAQGILNGLEQVGLVHMLAEPDATVISGETSKTMIGGQFPVPTAKDNQGNVTLEFKQYGVGLSFTPVVLSPNRISIQMSTEVSELSNTGAFQLQGGTAIVNGVTVTTPGLTIPGLTMRRSETTVEMPSGGSLAIAGLIQHVDKQVIDGFPGLKDMPVLGALFRSRDFQNDETELVILVSAYLVEPTSAAAFSAPTDGFQEPSDPETLLMGKLNATYKPDAKPDAAKSASAGGFIVQ